MSKYFSEDELRCKCGCNQCLMDSDFLNLMDQIREDVGEPLGAVSGYRCSEHDKKINGDDNHPQGKAVDLAAPVSRIRFKIINSAIKRGVKRIGVAKTFIHLDTVDEHPQEVIWLY